MSAYEASLPPDVFHLICNEFSVRADFDSLYNCVVSSRYFAASGAISSLYRISHECFTSATRARETAEDVALAGQILQKTAIMWRSIILSSQDKTLFPYCQHLRVLDLRDLGGLLDDGRFSGTKIADYFFKGSMSQFLVRNVQASGRAGRGLNITEILTRVGTAVLGKAHMIESLSEPVVATILTKMLSSRIDRLAHLKQLELANGELFNDSDMRALLHNNCPHLEELRILSYINDNSDSNLAAFLNGLPANTLVVFENFSHCGIRQDTCAALTRHGKSLKRLKLMLDESGFGALPRLIGCLALESLALEGTGLPLSLKDTLADEFAPTVEWLRSCTMLDLIHMKNIKFAPELLVPILETNNDLLRSLKVGGDERNDFALATHTDFFSAIANQKRLHELCIAAQADGLADIELLSALQDICRTKTLRVLEVRRMFDTIAEQEGRQAVGLISSGLAKLETLYYSGNTYGDAYLESILHLSALKSLTFAGISAFSFAGLKSFVESLGEGNNGLALTIDFADPDDNPLNLDQQQEIRKMLENAHGGTFFYTLLREEAETSESNFSD